MDGLELERDRLREAIIVALAALRHGHPTEALHVLAGALDATGLDDGRETARIIAHLYRLQAGEREPEPMTMDERDDADETYGQEMPGP